MRIAAPILLAITALFASSTSTAQDVTPEQRKLLAKRAAEADAYCKLAETVYGLQINARTYVKDFITESDDIRTEVDAFVKGVRLGTPTWYDDGSCEVPAEVTVAKVVETLRAAHAHYYRGDDIKTEDIESITRRIDKKIFKVIGLGAPRSDLPPRLPQPAAELLGPAPEGFLPAIPEIWLKIGPVAKLSAMRMARRDAQRRLAERIKGLRLTAHTQVRDFVVESDVITTDLDAFLIGAEERGGQNAYYLHDDELIAECTLVVPTEQVIQTIKELHSRHYHGDDLKTVDIEKTVHSVIKRDFEATGMGIPNPRFIEKYVQTTQAVLPDWSLRPLEVDGQAADPDMDSPLGQLRAARAAEVDAQRKLAQHIADLRLPGDTPIRDFVTEHDHLSGLVDAVVIDALVTNTRFTTEAAVVTVQLPGMRVWSIFDQEIRRSARRVP